MRCLLCLLCVLPSLAGCIFVETAMVEERGHEQCRAELLLAAPSADKFESVAAFSVTSGYAIPKREIIERVRQEACLLGADAAYIQAQHFGSCMTLTQHQVSAVALRRR